MAFHNNIFCASNPACIADALWRVLSTSGVDLADMLIFLPSRRAVRTVEKMLVDKSGGAVVLPRLVPLGEAADVDIDDDDISASGNVECVSNITRVAAYSRLLQADATIGTMAGALPVAHDLVRLTDYLENEGVEAAQIDWGALVDERYATHFQAKAKILGILATVTAAAGRPTVARARNAGIRAWIDKLNEYKLVVVCASTASVPATSDLMVAVAAAPHGRIILPGKIRVRAADAGLNTNPYNAEYKFLRRIGIAPDDVIVLDVGSSSVIDFMNAAFSNAGTRGMASEPVCMIECAREAEEAAVVAHIAADARAAGRSVLVITPDAAGNQRIAAEMTAIGIDADFSGGIPGTMTGVGRALLNMFDDLIERDDNSFERAYMAADFDFMATIVRLVDARRGDMAPVFDFSDAPQIWDAIGELSMALNAADVRLNTADARAFLSDVIGTATVRADMQPDVGVCVLGTIESRMQTADVVILTGLNEGMFPARGYENAWLPKSTAEKIGLPSPDRKVSLQALDFMNLSCGKNIYWTRSRTAGGVATTESRFISRVRAAGAQFRDDVAAQILNAVRGRDVHESNPLDKAAPQPPADWSDVYVTELEMLIHNPYAFYARHILRLRPMDDYWVGPDARTFGNLVHSVLEDAPEFNADKLQTEMSRRAAQLVGTDSVMYHFWQRRFVEIAPVAAELLSALPRPVPEISGAVNIAGRRVRARADWVYDGGVMDVKTGAAPSKKQLIDGNMPQLPLEAYMLKTGGFERAGCENPTMMFLQLRAGDVRVIVYDAQTTAQMMRAAADKATELFNMYSAGGAPYEYFETSDRKYRAYDDLARRGD